jgi:DNA-binding HxlR family transcriptional regulator
MLLSECPVRATIDVIEGKWKPIIVNALKDGTLRFGELRHEVPEASKKVLTGQLRALENDRIVVRISSEKRWERVEYSLTAYGRTLVPVLTLMAEWGKTHRRSKEAQSLQSIG